MQLDGILNIASALLFSLLLCTWNVCILLNMLLFLLLHCFIVCLSYDKFYLYVTYYLYLYVTYCLISFHIMLSCFLRFVTFAICSYVSLSCVALICLALHVTLCFCRNEAILLPIVALIGFSLVLLYPRMLSRHALNRYKHHFRRIFYSLTCWFCEVIV